MLYPESVPENIACPSLFSVKCPCRMLEITRVQKKYHEVKLCVCGGGGGVHEGPN